MIIIIIINWKQIQCNLYIISLNEKAVTSKINRLLRYSFKRHMYLIWYEYFWPHEIAVGQGLDQTFRMCRLIYVLRPMYTSILSFNSTL